MPVTRTYAAPADLSPDIVIQAEAMWAVTLNGHPGAFDDIDERLADLLGLGPGDGHDELTRCDVEDCNAWFWADEGADVHYEDGAVLTVCPPHAQADDPGARVYPGAGLLAVWEAQRDAEMSARIRATGRSW